MNIHTSGTKVVVPLSFLDVDENDISNELLSPTYRLLDENDSELIPSTVLDLSSKTLEISSEFNVLQDIDLKNVKRSTLGEIQIDVPRTVEVTAKDQLGNTQTFYFYYVLSPKQRLIVGFNTFQTLPHAFALSASLSGTFAWQTATRSEQESALIEAKMRIGRFGFTNTGGQANQTAMFSNSITCLNDITPHEFLLTNINFRQALCKAQILEAVAVLTYDESLDLASQGLIEQTIGETSERYTSTMKAKRSISNKAFSYLTKYIDTTMKIGRA